MASSVEYLVVLCGGGIGAILRHAVNRLALALVGAHFPVSTLFVNIVGSFVMGLLTAWFGFRGTSSDPTLRLFLTTGVLGGFTTFSTFSIDTAMLWERGQFGSAAVYVAGSVIVSLVGVFAGLAIARMIQS